ncbi:helix-turn-helix transcriptional regulator [Jannaschia sp. CCS1]|uniref:helix-turn-helix transcriptional regulator n=1 Tax=Jannaschia sp. (strain CCS1) TaxID=290400 RepID=UPI000053AE90|nr:LuxR family transcriptional regulator [Jannaschia sp. CCS1]ABD56110.1 transcriptional regulator, LuxR family [Jannaschia sp. CCS1]
MIQRLQDFSEDIIGMTGPRAVWAGMAHLADDLGMPFCTLTMARRAPDLRSSQFITNLPAPFQDTYCEGGFINDDPFLSLICRDMTAAGFMTDPDDLPEADQRQGAFLDLTRSFGVGTALCIPVRTTRQSEFGGWVIGGDLRARDVADGREIAAMQLQLAGLIAFERLSVLTRQANHAHRRLSPRERECLQWLSAGLRVTQIAHRLDISESAVHLYIKNARRKFGARTREQAVAHAIVSGEIEL